jgi:hypothetical protein
LAVAGKSEESSIVLQATEILFDKLQKEAYEVAMVGSPSLFPSLYELRKAVLMELYVSCEA